MSAMVVCPCCAGKGEVEDIAAVPLSRRERKIIAAAERAGHIGIPTSHLVDLIYADDPDGGPEGASKVVNVQICRLNKKLAAVGRRIQATGSVGSVYRMVSA